MTIVIKVGHRTTYKSDEDLEEVARLLHPDNTILAARKREMFMSRILSGDTVIYSGITVRRATASEAEVVPGSTLLSA